jgi:hypothetical protein
MSSELGVGAEATVALYCSQPGIWGVSQPSIIKDRWAARRGCELHRLTQLPAS